MRTFITSDLHFGHGRIRTFCPATRAHFTDADHMNSEMIRMWNETVSPDDLTYILGDVAFMPAEKAADIINQLNGKKILIAGNHDEKLIKNGIFRSCFVEIHQYLEIKVDNTFVVMFHYPIFDHNRAGYGSIMLHGHKHGTPHNIPGRIMDVGMDATGAIAVDLNEVVEKMKHVPHMYHHDRKNSND